MSNKKNKIKPVIVSVINQVKKKSPWMCCRT